MTLESLVAHYKTLNHRYQIATTQATKDQARQECLTAIAELREIIEAEVATLKSWSELNRLFPGYYPPDDQ